MLIKRKQHVPLLNTGERGLDAFGKISEKIVPHLLQIDLFFEK